MKHRLAPEDYNRLFVLLVGVHSGATRERMVAGCGIHPKLREFTIRKNLLEANCIVYLKIIPILGKVTIRYPLEHFAQNTVSNLKNRQSCYVGINEKPLQRNL